MVMWMHACVQPQGLEYMHFCTLNIYSSWITDVNAPAVVELVTPKFMQLSVQYIAVTTHSVGVHGSLVVMALRYKPAGCRFDSRWCHWNFSVT